MIEYEKKHGVDPVVVFILISVLIHGLLFYFIPKLPTPKTKSEKPISVKLIEEPVKGEKKPPKKPHALGKENITVKKEMRPEDKPKVEGAKRMAKRLPVPIPPAPLKKPTIQIVPPPKAPPKPKKKVARVPKPQAFTKKPSSPPKKGLKPEKKILTTPKKERIKIAEARPKRTIPPPVLEKEKPSLKKQTKGPSKTEGKQPAAPRGRRVGPSPPQKSPSLPAPKSLFPSPETLHQIERKFSHTYPKDLEKGDTISLNTKNYKYISYFTHIKRKIELVWEYPRVAAELGQEGRLTLRFTILKDGRLAGVRLVQSSGYHLLDEEALHAVKEAAPFHPIPDRLKTDHLNILANFTYTLGFKFVY